MARTKKQEMDKEAGKKMQGLQQKPSRDWKSYCCDTANQSAEPAPGSRSACTEDSSDSHTSGSMTSYHNLPLSQVSHISLPKAFVRVQDICKTPDEDVLKMMKRQIKNDVRGDANSFSSSGERDETLKRKLSETGTGDKTVSSSSTACSKNIFEQFGTEVGGRRSPRHSGSPRGSLSSSSSVQDNAPSRCGSEEKQQLSIASAVKALRGISEKVGEGRGKNKTQRESNSSRSSREGSPRTQSPKKQSPRRSGDKMSPPDAGLKAPKVKKTNSPPSSESSDSSPIPVKRVLSPRRPSPDQAGGLLMSPQTSGNNSNQGKLPSHGSVGATSTSSTAVKDQHGCIRILSSTSHTGGAKVLPVEMDSPSPSKASRILFSNTDSRDKDAGNETRDGSSMDNKKACVGQGYNNSKQCTNSQTPKQNVGQPSHDASKSDDTDSSLLCAMLVGGSEVTKNYEQSREQKSHTGVSQPSPSTSHLFANDTFFDDDSLQETHEAKPFELPVLSRLPPLPQPNLAILELTKTEKPETSEPDSLNKALPGHVIKTSTLLNLISKVKDNLHLSTDDSGEKDVTESEVSPSECNSQESVYGSASQESAKSTHAKKTSYTVLSSTSVPKSKSAESFNSKVDGFRNDMSGCTHNDTKAVILNSDVATSCTSLTNVNEDLQMSSDSTVKTTIHLPVEVTLKAQAPDQSKESLSESVSKAADGHSAEKPGTPDSLGELDTAQLTKAADGHSAEKPGTPDSLGELDTAQITKAATQAVDFGQGEEESGQVLEATASSGCSGLGHSTTAALSEGSQPQTASSDSGAQASTWQLSPSLCSRPQAPSSRGLTTAASDHSILISTTGARALAGSSASCSRPRLTSHPGVQSPVKKRWQPKVQSIQTEGGHLWSRSHTVVSPSSLEILSRPIKYSSSNQSAFCSRDLDQYLHNPANRITVPAAKESRLAEIVLSESKYKSYEELQQVLRKSHSYEHHGSDGEDMLLKSDEDYEDHDDEKDHEMSKKVDPDFEVLDGLVFASFQSEMAMHAHMTVEKVLKWDKEPMAFINIAKLRAFEESRRQQGDGRRESQGLRGVHMRWRKYQRLYRRELKNIHEENGVPWLFGKVSEKSSDITKIKNWKRKFGDIKTEDGHDSQGEESQQKVKRKRKTYVFSTKKKVKRLGVVTDKDSDHDTSFGSFKAELAEDNEDLDSSLEVSDDGEYGRPIPIDEDDYMAEVQNSLMEMDMKQRGMRRSRTIFTRLNMGPEDRHIFKKLGGWVTRLRMYRRMPNDKGALDAGSDKEKKKQRKQRREIYISLPFITSAMAEKAVSVLQLNSVPGPRVTRSSSSSNDASRLSGGGESVDQADTSHNIETKTCDKPGCRYGCICHLCQPSGESDEQEQPAVTAPQKRSCDKEYCRLGCICESLEKSSQHSTPSHCRKPECVLSCNCKPASQDEVQPLSKEPDNSGDLKDKTLTGKADAGDTADSSGDELPTLEKTTARRQRSTDRYSNLPRRQTSYRVAKNLDAVSRKAMMLYETSEIYWEQKCLRRKKSTDPSATPSPPTSSTATSPAMSSTLELTGCQTLPPNPMQLAGVIAGAAGSSDSVAREVFKKYSGNLNSADGSLMRSQEPHMNSSAVSNSDEDIKDATSNVSGPNYESKRSRMKRKIFEHETASSSIAPRQTPVTTSTATLAAPTVPFYTAPMMPRQPSPTPAAEALPFNSAICRWHTSMVCLKANPVSKPKELKSDDVQEEDEIKLLEFITNCNWDSAKREILYKVAGCLTRGQYPPPKVMLVGDFRVEILPKATKRSVIPQELRNRLPEMMYSIRVRVTQYKNFHTAQPVMMVKNTVGFSSGNTNPFLSGLSGLSPVNTAGIVHSPNMTGMQGMSLAGNAALGPPYRFSGVRPPAPTPREAPTPTSMGISGLSRLQISQNKPQSVSQIQAAQVESFRFQAQVANGGKKSTVPAATDDQASKKKKKKKKKIKQELELKEAKKGQEATVSQPAELIRDTQPSPIPPSSAKAQDVLVKSPLDLSVIPLVHAAPGTVHSTGGCINKMVKPQDDAADKPPMKPVQELPVKAPSTQDVARKAPVLATPLTITQVLPAGKGHTPVSGQGVGRAQLLGVPGSHLGDIKFIQLPGQGGILQLLPANALGIKPAVGKGVPNYVAIPLTLAPISVAGKKGGTNTQVSQLQISPIPGAFVSPVGGHLATTGANQPTSKQTGDLTAAAGPTAEPSVKKKKKRKKILAESDTNATHDSTATAASATALASALQSLRVTPIQNAPLNLQTSSTSTESSLPLQSPSKALAVTVTSGAISTPLMAAKTSDIHTESTSHSDIQGSMPDLPPVGVNSKHGLENRKPVDCATPSVQASTLEITHSGSDTPTRADDIQSGVGKCPAKPSPSLSVAGPSAPASHLSVPPALQPHAYPVHLVRNEMAWESNSCENSNSSFSDDEIDILSWSEDEDDVETGANDEPLKPHAQCLQCKNAPRRCNQQGVLGSMCPGCENLSSKRAKKNRERQRRARHTQMFDYLRQIMYAHDPTSAVSSSSKGMSHAKLLSKAALLVKYQQRVSMSLKKGVSVENKRNAMLQRQLIAHMDALKVDGFSKDAIASIISSVPLPPASNTSREDTTEKRLLQSGQLFPTDGIASVESVPSAHPVSTASPWQVEPLTTSVSSSAMSSTLAGTNTVRSSSALNSLVHTTIGAVNSTSDCMIKGVNADGVDRQGNTKSASYWKKSDSSEFVIEIEKAEEDEHFQDEGEDTWQEKLSTSPLVLSTADTVNHGVRVDTSTVQGTSRHQHKEIWSDSLAEMSESDIRIQPVEAGPEEGRTAESEASHPLKRQLKWPGGYAVHLKEKRKDSDAEEHRRMTDMEKNSCPSPIYSRLSNFAAQNEQSDRTNMDFARVASAGDATWSSTAVTAGDGTQSSTAVTAGDGTQSSTAVTAEGSAQNTFPSGAVENVSASNTFENALLMHTVQNSLPSETVENSSSSCTAGNSLPADAAENCSSSDTIKNSLLSDAVGKSMPSGDSDTQQTLSENQEAENEETDLDEADGTLPVIMSVTSLQYADLHFGEGDIIAS